MATMAKNTPRGICLSLYPLMRTPEKHMVRGHQRQGSAVRDHQRRPLGRGRPRSPQTVRADVHQLDGSWKVKTVKVRPGAAYKPDRFGDGRRIAMKDGRSLHDPGHLGGRVHVDHHHPAIHRPDRLAGHVGHDWAYGKASQKLHPDHRKKATRDR